jgi:hypothetical protein
MKFRPVGAQLFHAERRTDRHDEGLFSQYCERAQIKTLAYERVFCHLTMSSSKHTHTKTDLPLLARKKKKPFPLKFLDAAQSI